ncbi:unnamed protein product [Penicillium palitans]
MSNQPSNNGPHKFKLANILDPRVDSNRRNQKAPDAHLGYARNYGKGGLHNNGTFNKLDPRVNLDQDKSTLDDFAAGSDALRDPEPRSGEA